MTRLIQGLNINDCLRRQLRLRQELESTECDAVLLGDPRIIHYFTGYWARTFFPPMFLLRRDGLTTLAAALPCDQPAAADETILFESNRIGTLVDCQRSAGLTSLQTRLQQCKRIGIDAAIPAIGVAGKSVTDFGPILRKLKRTKDADEVEVLRASLQACEAAYTWAFENLSAGISEIEMYAGMQAAAIRHAGEPIGEFGNDFQIGAVGSAPRDHKAQNGEVAVFDLGLGIRGYRGDMCRSFVVGGQPSEQQLGARSRILEVFAVVEAAARPGARCRELFQSAHAMLNDFNGWVFGHHLGHGIGIDPHEAPRINPHWDDLLQIGDVFTVEPGLYGPELRAGLRIEQVYWLTEHGPQMLTGFHTRL